MTTLQENALTILRVMHDLGAVGRNFKPVPEIYSLSQLDQAAFRQADRYLLDAGLINGSFHRRIGRRWVTEQGVGYLKEALAGRMPLSLAAERVLRYLVDGASDRTQPTRHAHLLYALSLEWPEYARACQQLLDLNLIEDRSGTTDQFQAILATEEGVQAVRWEFRNLLAPSAQLPAGADSEAERPLPEDRSTLPPTIPLDPDRVAGDIDPPGPTRVDLLLEVLIDRTGPHLSIEQKAAYLSAAAEFKRELSRPHPGAGRLHQLLTSLSFFGDLRGTLPHGAKSLDLAARVAPQIAELTQVALGRINSRTE